MYDREVFFPAALGVGALLFWGVLLLYSPGGSFPFSLRRIALFLLFLAGLGMTLFRFQNLPKLIETAPHISGEEGLVVSERSWGGMRVHIIETSQGKFLYKTFAREGMKEGAEILFSGDILPFEKSEETGRDNSSFDERKYWGARGVFGEFRGKICQKASGSFWSIPRWRSYLKKELLLNFPPSLRGYLLATWVGARDPELEERHRRWGTAHLLAISGFHVGLVLFLLLKTFPPLLGNMRFLLVSVGMWSYILFAGASPSALRAGLMAQILLLGRFLGYRGNGANAVALGASLLLLWRPWWFWDLGWRLSVLAALGITLLAGFSWKAAFFGSSPIIWGLTAAPLVKVFGSVPLGAVVLNFFLLPVYALLFPLCFLGGALFFLHIPGREVILLGEERLLEFWHFLVEEMFALFPFSLENFQIALFLGSSFLALLLVLNIVLSLPRRIFCFCITAGGLFFFAYEVI